jgi:hypothetical protein
MAAQQQAPKDYTRRFNKGGSSGGSTSSSTSSTAKPKGPDNVVHHPPIVLFGLGGFGFGAGILTNIWQVFTTFIALWAMFNVGSGNLNLNWQAFWQRQPVVALICLLIATCAQYFLQLLVFKLDTTWKNERAEGKTRGGALVGATVRIVQQTDIITILSFLAFVVDTVGDFTFISLYTSSIFLIFAYAVALYAFSTLGFVRGIEYLWAGWAAMYKGGK